MQPSGPGTNTIMMIVYGLCVCFDCESILNDILYNNNNINVDWQHI